MEDPYFERIHALEKSLAVFINAMDLRLIASDNAMNLYRAELTRRLDLLNGEAGKLHNMQMTYWPREVAEAAMKEIRTTMEANFVDVRGSIQDLKEFRGNMMGRQAMMAAGVSIVVSIVIAALMHFLK